MMPAERRAQLIRVLELAATAAELPLFDLIEHAASWSSPEALLADVGVKESLAAAEWVDLLNALLPFWQRARQLEAAALDDQVRALDLRRDLLRRQLERLRVDEGELASDNRKIVRTTARLFRHAIASSWAGVCETPVPAYGGWQGPCTCGELIIERAAGVSTEQ